MTEDGRFAISFYKNCWNSAKIKFNVVIKRARPGKQLEKMSFEDVRNALLVAYGDGFFR